MVRPEALSWTWDLHQPSLFGETIEILSYPLCRACLKNRGAAAKVAQHLAVGTV